MFAPLGGTLSASLQMSKSSIEAKELQKLQELNFKYCTPKCDVSMLSPKLVDMIIMAQKMSGHQFTITSAFRSREWELSKGRKGTSSHCCYSDGKPCSLAVDVRTVDSHTRFKFVIAAVYAGFERIGIGKNFIHLDIDENKAHPIIFHYYDPQET